MPSVLESLKMNRYRLLYYIVAHKGRLRDEPNLKARLRDLFGYESDGHFYYDWDFLLNEKFLELKDGFFVATKKARSEFRFIFWLILLAVLTIVVGGILLFYWISLVYGFLQPLTAPTIGYVIYTSAVFLVGFGVASLQIVRSLIPSGPSKDKLRDSRL